MTIVLERHFDHRIASPSAVGVNELALPVLEQMNRTAARPQCLSGGADQPVGDSHRVEDIKHAFDLAVELAQGIGGLAGLLKRWSTVPWTQFLSGVNTATIRTGVRLTATSDSVPVACIMNSCITLIETVYMPADMPVSAR